MAPPVLFSPMVARIVAADRACQHLAMRLVNRRRDVRREGERGNDSLPPC
jgi:hypothetical protein